MVQSSRLMAWMQLADILPCGLVVTDLRGYVLLWNHYMAEITGLGAQQMHGELIFQWFPELETVAVNARVPFSRNNRQLFLQTRSQSLDQGHMWTFLSEVEPRKIDFASVVSHELRIPLTSIKGFVDTLLRSRDQLNEEQQVRFLTIIKNQADRLTRLVEDILLMSQAQSDYPPDIINPVAIEPVLRRILENLPSQCGDHPVIWEVPEDLPVVCADEDRLEQIFLNLLDNAFKYSPQGSPVTVRAWIDSTFVAVAVQDQGMGISPDSLDWIFDQFARVEKTNATVGSGLGLYITRSLVESLGGQISVQSIEGQGSTFTVLIPIICPVRVPPGRPINDPPLPDNPPESYPPL